MITYDVSFGIIDDIKLTRLENKMLLGLLQNDILDGAKINQICEAAPNSRVHSTRIHRLRKLLDGVVTIHNRRLFGYYIPQEDKDKIKIIGLNREYKSPEYITEVKTFIEEELATFQRSIDVATKRLIERFNGVLK